MIYYFRNSFASREISQEIRDEIDTLINEAAKDMLNHWTNTNRSLQVCVFYNLCSIYFSSVDYSNKQKVHNFKFLE